MKSVSPDADLTAVHLAALFGSATVMLFATEYALNVPLPWEAALSATLVCLIVGLIQAWVGGCIALQRCERR